MDSERPSRPTFISFLLAQVGSHASKQFAKRLFSLGLAPPHAGILRRLAQSSGLSQRELATQLGMHASRLVAVVDELESLGLVVREGNADDRRSYSLRLTAKGAEVMGEVGKISKQHNEEICAALNPEERETLSSLLQRIADQQGLIRGVHPGYAALGRRAASSREDDDIKAKQPVDPD